MNVQQNPIDILYIRFPCPECRNEGGLPLQILYTRQAITCPSCHQTFEPMVDTEPLHKFMESYEALQQHFASMGLPLLIMPVQPLSCQHEHGEECQHHDHGEECPHHEHDAL